MANKKQKLPIQVPASGVRKDVDEMLRDGTMASEGDNCLYFDGAIRPRPALTKEIYEELALLSESIDDVYTSPAGSYIRGFFETPAGYLVCCLYTNSWVISVDGGANWSALTASGAPVNGINNMFVFGDYVFGFQNTAVYRAPISTLPTSLTFTTIIATGLTAADQMACTYDSVNDALVVTRAGNSSNVAEIVYDATGTATHESVPVPTTISGTTCGTTSAGWVNEKWLVVPSYNLSGGFERYIECWPLEWGGSSYDFDTTQAPADSWLVANATSNIFGGGAVTDVAYAPRTQLITDCQQNNGFVCAVTSYAEADTPAQIAWIGMDRDGFVRSSLFTREIDLVQYPATIVTSTTNANQICYIEDGADQHTSPVFWVSSDGGFNWMTFSQNKTYVPVIGNFRLFTLFSNCSNWMVSYISTGGGAGSDYSILSKLPSALTGSKYGDVTTLHQADLPDEDDAIIMGTTHAWCRLDRDTNTWTRITADDTETVEGAVPDEWTETGDIPPLSCYPDDTNYKTGISIEGTYGENPWVFRTFEAQGETFLMGTNGQCYPLIYHPDMPGNMARRMGEMTPDDPNYNALADSPTGDLAPKAKCIATAANRVLLANDPSGSGYSVSVGAFNDPDRGWGSADYQLVLLGDTPGSIVSMNEISALQVAVYKTDAIYHAIAQTEFLDVSAPFRFELSKAGISGPCSPNSILRNFDGRQIYMARDGGVYMYDGVAPLDAGRNVRRMIQEDIDLDNLGKVWGMVDRRRKLVWFFYPTTGGVVNKGIVLSTDQGYPWPCWPVSLPAGWNFVSGLEAKLISDAKVGDLGPFDSYPDGVTLSSFESGRTEMLMSIQNGTLFSQKYDSKSAGDYTDDGIGIYFHLQTGWASPGGFEMYTADTMHHLFSCPDDQMKVDVILRAQQIGQRIRESKISKLWAAKGQRRTHHRVSGMQFSLDLEGRITSPFRWAGGPLSYARRGGR